MRSAFRRWQSIISRLEIGRVELTRDLLLARTNAQNAGVDALVGILNIANSMTETAIPDSILRVHNSISNTFSIMGTSFLRMAPSSLKDLLDIYDDRIEEICKGYGQMSLRLKTADTVLEAMNQFLYFDLKLSPHFVLTSPEVAETILALKKRKYENKKIFIKRLQIGFNSRLEIGRQWLHFLQEKMNPTVYRQKNRELDRLAQKPSQMDFNNSEGWLELHRKIGNNLIYLNRLAVKSIAKR